MGPDVQLAYEHRGRVGAQWAQRHSGAQWVCLGLLGHTGAQAPPGHTGRGGVTLGHPEAPSGGYRTHMHTPTGAQAQTHSHRDTQPQRHTATEKQGHTGTQRHRDTEAQRHRDTETDTDSGKVGGVSVCVPCPHGWL